MQIKIQRTDQYVASLRIATGDNTPAFLAVDVSPSDLTDSARRLIIQAFRKYPETLEGINYDRAYVPSARGTFGRIYFQADLEEADAETVSALIEGAFATLEDQKKAAEKVAADREQEKADALAAQVVAVEVVVYDYLASPYSRPNDYTGTFASVSGIRLGDGYPDGVWINGWHPRWSALKAETERRLALDHAKEMAEKEAAASRRSAQIAAWVGANGDENQKGRYALGLLPEGEILHGIRDEQFAALCEFPRYKKPKAIEIPCLCVWDEGVTDPSFSVAPATEADAGTYDSLSAITEAIRAVHPEAWVDLRVHTAWCPECGEEIQRRGVLVTITVGELILSREYAA